MRNWEGIEALAKPTFVRGSAPSMEAALPPAHVATGGDVCDASKRVFGLFFCVYQIRFNPLFRMRHIFSSKMDSLAWLRCAGAGRARLR